VAVIPSFSDTSSFARLRDGAKAGVKFTRSRESPMVLYAGTMGRSTVGLAGAVWRRQPRKLDPEVRFVVVGGASRREVRREANIVECWEQFLYASPGD